MIAILLKKMTLALIFLLSTRDCRLQPYSVGWAKERSDVPNVELRWQRITDLLQNLFLKSYSLCNPFVGHRAATIFSGCHRVVRKLSSLSDFRNDTRSHRSSADRFNGLCTASL